MPKYVFKKSKLYNSYEGWFLQAEGSASVNIDGGDRTIVQESKSGCNSGDKFKMILEGRSGTKSHSVLRYMVGNLYFYSRRKIQNRRMETVGEKRGVENERYNTGK